MLRSIWSDIKRTGELRTWGGEYELPMPELSDEWGENGWCAACGIGMPLADDCSIGWLCRSARCRRVACPFYIQKRKFSDSTFSHISPTVALLLPWLIFQFGSCNDGELTSALSVRASHSETINFPELTSSYWSAVSRTSTSTELSGLIFASRLYLFMFSMLLSAMVWYSDLTNGLKGLKRCLDRWVAVERLPWVEVDPAELFGHVEAWQRALSG